MQKLKTVFSDLKLFYNAQFLPQKLGFWACVFVCVLGFIFTVWAFLLRGMSHDEIYSLTCTLPSTSFGQLMQGCIMTDANPPLYLWLLFALNKIFFINADFWARLPSLICWVLAVIAGFALYPKKYGQWARIIFITLLLGSAHFLLLMIGARAYAPAMLFAVLITFLSLSIFDDINSGAPLKNKNIILFNLYGLILCFLHYYGALLYGLLGFFALIAALYNNNRAWRFFAGGIIAVFGIYAFWLVPSYLSLTKIGILGGGWWIKAAPWVSSTELFNIAFTADLTQYVFFALLILSLIKFKPAAEAKAAVLLPMTLFCGAYFSMYIISYKINMMQGRYFILFLPALYVALSIILGQFLGRAKYNVLAFIIFLGFALYGNLAFAKKNYATGAEIKNFTARYHAQYAGRPILLASNYLFNDKVVEAVFSYYLNNSKTAAPKFINILNKEGAQKDALLNMPGAIIYMPGCTQGALEKLQSLTPYTELYRDYKLFYCILAPTPAAPPAN